MNADRLLALYEKVAEAPDALPRLRRFVLDLAVRGKLVAQDPTDEPASELLTTIARERNTRVKRREIKRAAPSEPVEDHPFEAPAGWEWIPLGDTGNIFSGNSINATTREQLEKTDEGLPFIATKDVGYGLDVIDYENGLLVPASDSRFKVARAKSVLICAEGGSAGRKIGLSDREICFGNKLLANETWSVIVPEFVRFVYMSDFFFDEFAARMTGVIGGISLRNFLQLPFPLPPLAEQRRIVVKVEELMALLDRLEAARTAREATRDRLTAASLARLTAPDADPADFSANARFALDALPALTTRPDQIKRLRQTILNLAVRGKLVPQDVTDGTGDDLLRQLGKLRNEVRSGGRGRREASNGEISSEEKYLEIPTSWAWARVHQVGTTQTGTSPSSANPALFGDHIPFVKPADLDGRAIKYDGPGLSEEGMHHSRVAQANTVLMVCIGATLGKVNITERSVCFNQQINAVTPFMDGLHRFISIALRASGFQVLAWSKAGTGTLPIISKGKWEALPIPLPPLAEQHRIVAKVDALMALCDRLEASLTATAATRRRLLDALLAEALAPVDAREMEAAE